MPPPQHKPLKPRSKRSVEKRLLRRNRARMLEQSHQRLKRAINGAALFTAAAFTVVSLFQLVGMPAPGTPSSGPLAEGLPRHYTFVFGVIPAAFFGSTFAFRFLAGSTSIGTKLLLMLGVVMGIASYVSFMPAFNFVGVLGVALWLCLIAVGITYAGMLVSRQTKVLN